MIKNNKGITLLVFAITIVVLLILAGISIGAISGQDSIFTSASEAKFKAEIKDIEEQIELKETQENNGNEYQFGSLESLLGITDQYNNILSIEDGDLVYDPEKVNDIQKKWLEEINVSESKKTIPIYTAEQFKKISSGEEVLVEQINRKRIFSSDANYSIQNDINLNGSESNKLEPLNSFNGILDGNNYKIINLYMNFAEGDKGIFTTNNGTIKNIEIKDCDVKIGYSSGIICGTNKGTIENIKITGKVEAISTSAGASNIGSICGNNSNTGLIQRISNYSTIIGKSGCAGGVCGSNSGVIFQCKNEGELKNTGSVVGGIVGRNNNIVKECINRGKISTGMSYTWSEGGICGGNYGNIENCYNTASLGSIEHWEQYIGGIVGGNSENANIQNCYSIAEMRGGLLGGIVSNNNGNIKNCCYIKKGNYDIQGPNSTGTVENSGEKTENEMKEKSILDLLNINNTENIWGIDKNKNNGYPYLLWER